MGNSDTCKASAHRINESKDGIQQGDQLKITTGRQIIPGPTAAKQDRTSTYRRLAGGKKEQWRRIRQHCSKKVGITSHTSPRLTRRRAVVKEGF